jgi:hypothetical protein
MLINQLTNERQWDYRRKAIENALAAAKRICVERASLQSMQEYSSCSKTPFNLGIADGKRL